LPSGQTSPSGAFFLQSKLYTSEQPLIACFRRRIATRTDVYKFTYERTTNGVLLFLFHSIVLSLQNRAGPVLAYDKRWNNIHIIAIIATILGTITYYTIHHYTRPVGLNIIQDFFCFVCFRLTLSGMRYTYTYISTAVYLATWTLRRVYDDREQPSSREILLWTLISAAVVGTRGPGAPLAFFVRSH